MFLEAYLLAILWENETAEQHRNFNDDDDSDDDIVVTIIDLAPVSQQID